MYKTIFFLSWGTFLVTLFFMGMSCRRFFLPKLCPQLFYEQDTLSRIMMRSLCIKMRFTSYKICDCKIKQLFSFNFVIKLSSILQQPRYIYLYISKPFCQLKRNNQHIMHGFTLKSQLTTIKKSLKLIILQYPPFVISYVLIIMLFLFL